MVYDPATGKNFDTNAPQDNALVEFFTEPVQNNFKSEQEGHPVFDEVEKVRIIQPGQKNTEVVERVKAEHRQRWPTQYAQFKEGLEQKADGFPIEEWPPINRALALTLKGLKIHTVEQLASVNDNDLPAIGMGGRALRDKAASYLAAAKDAKPLAEAIASRERAEEELQLVRRELDEMRAMVEKLAAEKANG